MQQADEERRIAALREEVQHLASGVGDVRRTLWRTFGVLAALGLAGATLAGQAMGLCSGIVLGSISAALFGLLLAGLVELLISGCRAQLRRRIAELPPEQRRAVVMPLARETSGDAWRIVYPLSRELRNALPLKRTEVAPAPVPEGRGDEPSASERSDPPV